MNTDTRKYFYTFAVIVVVVCVWSILTNNAHALIRAWDEGGSGPSPQFSTNSGTGACSGWSTSKEYSLLSGGFDLKCILSAIIPSWDGVANYLKDAAVETIKNNVLQWAQNGFQGTPVFIQDPNSYFEGIAEAAGGTFMRDFDETIRKNQLLGVAQDLYCGNFFQRDVLSWLPRWRSGMYSQSRPWSICSITGGGGQLAGFYQDFRNGGFKTWDEVQLAPNNPFGFFIMTEDERQKIEADRLRNEMEQSRWSNGFQGNQECDDPDDGPGRPCNKFKKQTPGQIVGDRLAKTIGTDFDTIVQADELSELVAGLIDIGINKAVINLMGNNQTGVF